MDKILRTLGIGMIALGGSIVILGGIGALIYCIFCGETCTPIVIPTVLIGFLISVGGLFPMLLRFFCN